MRFGISEISWMLPKLLRIRRAVLERPIVVAGSSIALVAMIFHALSGARASERSARLLPERAGDLQLRLSRSDVWSACPVTLSNAFGPCAVRTLSRRGREKPRAHVTVRRSRLFVGCGRYNPICGLVKGQFAQAELI